MGVKNLLGKKIKKLRIINGYTQEELAEKIDISQRALSGIETGKNFLTAETLDKLVQVLNIKYSELFCIDHYYDTKVLINDLNAKIISLKNCPEKLREIYRVINALLNE